MRKNIDMKYIIYGAGMRGQEFLEDYGTSGVACFADNSIEKWGKFIRGKAVLPISEAKMTYPDCLWLVAIDVINLGSALYELRAHDLNRYLCYMAGYQHWDWKNVVQSPEEYIRLSRDWEIQSLIRRDKEMQERSDFLRECVVPSTLETPGGYLHGKQDAILNFADNLLRLLRGQNIHPILSAGNLLGYVRHHGDFIPWDDDLDFTLIREDYDRLCGMLRSRYKTVRYSGPGQNPPYGRPTPTDIWIENQLEMSGGEPLFIEYPQHTQLVCGTSFLNMVSIDFFSIDVYVNGYPFKEHLRYVNQMKDELNLCKSAEEKYPIIKRYKEEDQKHWDSSGDNLYYGLDNFESYQYYHDQKDYLHREDVFPLREGTFRSISVWIPNNPEQCIPYNFGPHWNHLPEDYGLSTHAYRIPFLQEYFPTCEIWIDTWNNVEKMREVYITLRTNKIRAVFVIEGIADKTLTTINNLQMETVRRHDPRSTYAILENMAKGQFYGEQTQIFSFEEDVLKKLNL